jgi:hypothetical protein
MIGALVIGGGIGLWGHFALRRLVPLAARRQATLEYRSLDHAVPKWVQRLTYVLVVANLLAWVAAGYLGTHSSPIFWERVAIMFGLSGFFFLITKALVVRRVGFMDRLHGPGYRVWELRMTFATQLTTPAIGALRLYEEVTGLHLLDLSRAVQLVLAAFIAAWLLGMSRLPVDPVEEPLGRADPAVTRLGS